MILVTVFAFCVCMREYDITLLLSLLAEYDVTVATLHTAIIILYFIKSFNIFCGTDQEITQHL